MKRYIFSMSLPRQRAMDQASFYAVNIIEHMIKIVMYHYIRSDDVLHWVDEISDWLQRSDDITIKPKGHKLKESDLLNTVFSCMGSSLSDYRRELLMFQEKNRRGQFNYADKESYPEFEVDYNACQELMDACNRLINSTLPLLADKQDHDIQDYRDAVSDALIDYLS